MKTSYFLELFNYLPQKTYNTNSKKKTSDTYILLFFQAVDVIGKAGTPKTIAGSHTHTTPVLLSFGERAELATDEYIPLSPVMEGFVILKKNEDSVMASVQ